MNKMQPLGDKVLIRPNPTETVSKGGIIIPQNAQKRNAFGKVIATSGDHDSLLAPGQTVLYPLGAGTPVKVEDVEHLLMSEEHVLAIIHNAE